MYIHEHVYKQSAVALLEKLIRKLALCSGNNKDSFKNPNLLNRLMWIYRSCFHCKL